MPHSIFTGRGMPGPGEQLFTQEDTALAMALALEERDECPSCHLPKSVCRDNKVGRARFDLEEHFCWATYRMASRKPKLDSKGNVGPTEKATLVSLAIRPGYEPDLLAGLDLEHEEG